MVNSEGHARPAQIHAERDGGASSHVIMYVTLSPFARLPGVTSSGTTTTWLVTKCTPLLSGSGSRGVMKPNGDLADSSTSGYDREASPSALRLPPRPSPLSVGSVGTLNPGSPEG
eukprot:CAMPEP_0182555750 /NCGR_PEP_ID=MMETSP1324-20130603/234_1 /TAXON_ID=236786 /ORGANISM="Florenciella sp., Strain RCC1587" /LENGTH=114 /DNA_ID=CAMNT_0024767533 /DNA_START=225 /DNA_END=567 /DNA_ORIENTATION=+